MTIEQSTPQAIRVAFDVDETLWLNGDYGQGGKPNAKVVRLFRALQDMGCYMIIWSAGGEQWAKECAEKCDLKPDECRAKSSLEGQKLLKHQGRCEVDLAVDDCEDCGIVTLFV